MPKEPGRAGERDMMMTSLRRGSRTAADRRCREDGAVAVEFVLVLPLLMMLVFGIIEFGFAFAQKASLAHGARDGARLGVVNIVSSSGCGDVIAEARRASRTVGMDESDVEVTVVQAGSTKCSTPAGSATPSGGTPPCTDAPLDDEMLHVTTEFVTSIDIPLVPSAPEITLTGEGAYRCEYN
jgi:Flp pilus assembly protein TadG